MPQHQIALFTFTLGRAESIGPQALRRLWAIASGSREVSVGRRESQWGDGNRPVYTLYAPQGLANLREVELRLRDALEGVHLHASLTMMP